MNVNVQIKRIKALLQEGDRQEICKQAGISESMLRKIFANDCIYPSTLPAINAALVIFEQRKHKVKLNEKRIKKLVK